MAMDRLNPEETMMEVGLLSTFNAIMQQSSLEIYEVRYIFLAVTKSLIMNCFPHISGQNLPLMFVGIWHRWV